MTIDVIIPLYKPDDNLPVIIERLLSQTVIPEHIILINTEEKYFKRIAKNTDLSVYGDRLVLKHIKKSDFDHGGTRRLAVKMSHSDIFVMLTQDALPVDRHLIEALTEPLIRSQGDVAVSYGRQLAGKNSGILEKFTRSFNYPQESAVKGEENLKSLGIKTFFCSNVCAAYDRAVYDKLGGFVEKTIFNEDMIYAAGAVKSGYKIAYSAGARVLHSHDYSCIQQFRRNFDLGVSQAEHPEVFRGISSESEGKRLVMEATAYFVRHRQIHKIPYFYIQCISKYAGYLLGKSYRRLPKTVILKLTANKEYWRDIKCVE